jgi:Ca2+-binding EF-hand superfamily protein
MYQDEDGFLSVDDLLTSCQELELGLKEALIRQFHVEMDTNRDSYVDMEEWLAAMQKADGVEEVLRSRGLMQSEGVSSEMQSDGMGTATSLKTVAEGINLIAASLQYNDLTEEEGYEQFDKDGDGKISFSDFDEAIHHLDPGLSTEIVRAVYEALDVHKEGFVDKATWSESIRNADVISVLEARGIKPPAESLAEACNLISAALRFNDLDLKQGFDAFDMDQDQKISIEDLKSAAELVKINLDDFQLRAVHQAMDIHGDGLVTYQGWISKLETAKGEELLRARGVEVTNDQTNSEETLHAPHNDQVGSAQNHAAHAPGQTKSLHAVADIIAAALAYNHLSPDDGYDHFDVDEDGEISLTDLEKAAQTLELDISHDSLAAFHRDLDSQRTGFISRDAWKHAIASADHKEVLQSRGVFSGSVALSASDELQKYINQVAAALSYNDLKPEEGYDSFDADEDGKVSYKDLQIAANTLELDLDEAAVAMLYNHLDPNKLGYIPLESWIRVLATANAEDVLRSRGVLPGDEPSGVGSEHSGPDMPTGGAPRTVQDCIDTVAAALTWNNLDIERGYTVFDNDGDGVVSLNDLSVAAETLQLGLTRDELLDMYQFLAGDNLSIPREAWHVAMGAANTEQVLKSRGIRVMSEDVAASIDVVAAALRFNGLSPKEGYDAFDNDGDGKVSFQDLQDAVDALNLDLTPEAVEQLFVYLEYRDMQYIDMEMWIHEISSARPEDVLKSRGVINSQGVERSSESVEAALDLKAVQKAIDAIAAALVYNNVSVQDGYDAMDSDGDGKLSLPDLKEASETLQLDLLPHEVEELYGRLDPDKMGYVLQSTWAKALDLANAADVLKSRGLASEPPKPVQDAINMIAAAMTYNKLTLSQGYTAVDADEDGKLSFGDLKKAAETLNLDLDAGQVTAVYQYLDYGNDGFIQRDVWERAMQSAHVDHILQSRGISIHSDGVTGEAVAKAPDQVDYAEHKPATEHGTGAINSQDQATTEAEPRRPEEASSHKDQTQAAHETNMKPTPNKVPPLRLDHATKEDLAPPAAAALHLPTKSPVQETHTQQEQQMEAPGQPLEGAHSHEHQERMSSHRDEVHDREHTGIRLHGHAHHLHHGHGHSNHSHEAHAHHGHDHHGDHEHGREHPRREASNLSHEEAAIRIQVSVFLCE